MKVLANHQLMRRLVNDVDTSRFILVCDHLGSDSVALIRTLIDNRLNHSKVNVVCFENDSQLYWKPSAESSADKTISHIKITDLLTENISIQLLIDSLANASDQSVVFVDSLTPLLATNSLYDISRLLSQLCGRFRQLVCVLHVDCHSQHVCQSVEQLSHSVIHLTTIEDKPDSYFKAIIRHRKPHRKTHFSVKESLELFSISDHNINYVTISGSTETQTTTDPTLDLPFNLNLKDTEIEAKNSLQLPYIKTDDNESKVFYEIDKNDDFDDDDPDDDLDI